MVVDENRLRKCQFTDSMVYANEILIMFNDVKDAKGTSY